MKRSIAIGSLFLALTAQAQLSSFDVGDTAPDFTGEEPDGTLHSLYDYTAQGKYVLVDFFAYWCGPCMSTAPKVQDFYEKYGCNTGNVVVLGNECDPGGTNELLDGFEASAGLDHETAYPSWSGLEGNGSAICNDYNPVAYPTIVLIAPDNTFINIDIWPISNVGDIEEAFPSGVLEVKDCAETTSVINTIDLPVLTFYPNPVSENAILSFVAPENGNLTLHFYAATGQLQKTIQLSGIQTGRNALEISVNDLPAGVYQVVGAMNQSVFQVSSLVKS